MQLAVAYIHFIDGINVDLPSFDNIKDDFQQQLSPS